MTTDQCFSDGDGAQLPAGRQVSHPSSSDPPDAFEPTSTAFPMGSLLDLLLSSIRHLLGPAADRV